VCWYRAIKCLALDKNQEGGELVLILKLILKIFSKNVPINLYINSFKSNSR